MNFLQEKMGVRPGERGREGEGFIRIHVASSPFLTPARPPAPYSRIHSLTRPLGSMEGGYINPSPSSLHCPAGTRGRGPTIAVSKPFVSLPSVLPSFMSGIWLSLFLSGSNYSNPFFPRTEPNSGFSSRRRFSRPPPPWSTRTKYTSRVRRRDDAGKVSDD